MKSIDVVAAVIYKDGKIFVTERGYGEYKDFWEFPGGKIEEGEAPEDALKREIREELDTEIEPVKLIDTVEYDYPSFHLSMRCYASRIVAGELKLLEHEDAKWLSRYELDQVRFLPADEELIKKIFTYWDIYFDKCYF